MTSDEVPLDSFFVKSSDWAYEEEVRIILPLSDASYKSEQWDRHLFSLPPEAITGVVLGAGATHELIEEIKALIATEKLAQVKLLRARLSLRTFGIEFARECES